MARNPPSRAIFGPTIAQSSSVSSVNHRSIGDPGVSSGAAETAALIYPTDYIIGGRIATVPIETVFFVFRQHSFATWTVRHQTVWHRLKYPKFDGNTSRLVEALCL
jgi:hypothetical protein